jgi:dihydrofolate reductase
VGKYNGTIEQEWIKTDKRKALPLNQKKVEWGTRPRNLDELKKVKTEEGSDIVLWGSSTPYPQLLDANLIDRLLLLTIPIVLGKGKRLFGNTSHQVALKLMKCEATPTGVIMATYEGAGAVPTGSL